MKHLFLFTNPTSGGNQASIFTEFAANEIVYQHPENCHLHIYNLLYGEPGNHQGFLKLKSVIDNIKNESKHSVEDLESKYNDDDNDNNNLDNIINAIQNPKEQNDQVNSKNKNYPKKLSHNDIPVYVIIAGGDGTLNWVLKESEAHGIDTSVFAISIIPFGTGNDFANAFGWKNPMGILKPKDTFSILSKVVNKVLKSEVLYHDYWNIEVILNEDGYFDKINSKTRKKEILIENNQNVKALKFAMANYFSIGIDSRIGRGFERQRKNNAILNKMVYLFEGFKKSSFIRNTPINLLIDKMTTGNNFEDIVFTTNKKENAPLLKKSMNIIGVNIPSYSAGNDIWKYTSKLGFKLPKDCNDEHKKKSNDLKYSEQKIGDGALEFVTYRKGWDMAFEFTFKGRAYRVHQGKGPWKIDFKENASGVYFQVDGEFFRMTKPKYISIKHYKKINVLKSIS
ncbi:diacylglycerol kinase, putative [Plasmodium vinckei vinckei]|uniref:Diacylglycerol kinase n=1 Tax=Plasmodium vinckei vinckei TaxID=54757 RepID=A0A449BYA9_PLAVN|nr:diacylglycerol kinase, putative [Plasmodium vinckei vinckei]KEG04781.1 diacylglycerol kinase [Plasmodium vinckei vinckei]VEV58434.1 diacylglycerol kinase, putative [Plasmodium vinckei vinckei]